MASSPVQGYQKRRWNIFLSKHRYSKPLQDALTALGQSEMTDGQKLAVIKGLCERMNIPLECMNAIKKYIDMPGMAAGEYYRLVELPVEIQSNQPGSVLLRIAPGANKTDIHEAIDQIYPSIKDSVMSGSAAKALSKRVEAPRTEKQVEAAVLIKFLKLLDSGNSKRYWTSNRISELLDSQGLGYYEPANIRKMISRDNKRPFQIPKL